MNALATITAAANTLRILGAKGQMRAAELDEARDQLCELIEAAYEVRNVAWGPGETDQPHIIRLDAALKALRGAA